MIRKKQEPWYRSCPDKEIFEETIFDFDTLKQRFREMAFLTKGLKIRLTDERGEKELVKEFHYEGGIKEFVTYLNRSKEALYPEIIYCEGMKDGVAVEVAMQHNDSYNETTYGSSTISRHRKVEPMWSASVML